MRRRDIRPMEVAPSGWSDRLPLPRDHSHLGDAAGDTGWSGLCLEPLHYRDQGRGDFHPHRFWAGGNFPRTRRGPGRASYGSGKIKLPGPRSRRQYHAEAHPSSSMRQQVSLLVFPQVTAIVAAGVAGKKRAGCLWLTVLGHGSGDLRGERAVRGPVLGGALEATIAAMLALQPEGLMVRVGATFHETYEEEGHMTGIAASIGFLVAFALSRLEK